MDQKPNGSRSHGDAHHSNGSRANGDDRHHRSNNGRPNDHLNGRGEHPNVQGERSNGRGEHPNGNGERSNGRGRDQQLSDRSSYHDRPSSASSRHSIGSNHSSQSSTSRSDAPDHHRDRPSTSNGGRNDVPSTSRGRSDQPSTSNGGRSRYDQHQGPSTSSQNSIGQKRCREFASEEPSSRPAKKPAFGEKTSRKKREEFFNQAITNPDGLNKKGKVDAKDKIMTLTANFFPVTKVKKFSVTCYRIDFEPEVDLRKVRGGLIFQHKPALGPFSYDGANMLYLMQALPKSPEILHSVSRENEKYKLKLVETRRIEYTEGMFLQVLNLAMRNAMRGLNLQLVGRNFYDPAAQVSNSMSFELVKF